jgi:hypothetical protein
LHLLVFVAEHLLVELAQLNFLLLAELVELAFAGQHLLAELAELAELNFLLLAFAEQSLLLSLRASSCERWRG